jgi:ribosomal protein S18 acetylase RimI-like enzyme
MAIEIKVLGSDDVAVLVNVAPDVFDDSVDPRMAAAFLRDSRHHLVVAIENDQVIGFVSAVHYIHPDKPRPELWINEIGVAPTHQGGGIGSDLLRSMLEVGRRNGCREAWVLTNRANDPAMRLYASNGGTASDAVMFTFQMGAKAGSAGPPSAADEP